MRPHQKYTQIAKTKETENGEDSQGGVSPAQYFIGLFSRQHSEDENGGSAQLHNIHKYHKNRIDIHSLSQANQSNKLSSYQQHQFSGNNHRQNSTNWHISFWHLIMVLGLGVIATCLYKDWQIEYVEQTTKLQQKQKNCEIQYQLNECDDPPPALKNNCTLYSFCIKERPIPRYTEVLSLVIAKLMKVFLSELGVIAIVVLVVVFGIYMRRPIMNVYYNSNLGDTHGHTYEYHKNALTQDDNKYRIKRD